MKPVLLVCILLFNACKKETFFNLTNNKTSCYDSCSNKISKKSSGEIKYLCPIDSIAIMEVEKWRSYLHKCITLYTFLKEYLL